MNTNQDIINAVLNDGSSEMRERLGNVPISNFAATLVNYPSIANEFMGVIANKIVKTLFFQKVFNNPLQMLHRGRLPFGKGVEEIFVEMAEKKGFNENFTGSTSDEGNLIKALEPNTKIKYITQNFAYKFKASVSQQQLAGAFINEGGLNDLINGIVNSLYSSVYYNEYLDMKKILTHQTADTSGGSTIGVGVAQRVFADTNLKKTALINIGKDKTTMYKELFIQLKTFVESLVFPSSDYNLAGVTTFSNKEDLVIFTTPKHKAYLDVNVLAGIFNLDLVQLNQRIIVVDDLGVTDTTSNDEIVCILADKDLIQAYDTINETNTFVNPEHLHTNYFAHKHGLICQCDFANSIVFYSKS